MRARAPGAVSVAHPLRLPSATPPHEPPALGFAAVGSQGRRRERPPQQADEAGIEDLVRSDASVREELRDTMAGAGSDGTWDDRTSARS